MASMVAIVAMEAKDLPRMQQTGAALHMTVATDVWSKRNVMPILWATRLITVEAKSHVPIRAGVENNYVNVIKRLPSALRRTWKATRGSTNTTTIKSALGRPPSAELLLSTEVWLPGANLLSHTLTAHLSQVAWKIPLSKNHFDIWIK